MLSRALPIVDISPFLLSAGLSARRSAAQALLSAGRSPGFFYLVGHGVPLADLLELHDLARTFFQQDEAAKRKWALSLDPASGRGFQFKGENVTKGRRDWHEALDFYAEPPKSSVAFEQFAKSPSGLCQAELEQIQRFALSPNRWPTEPAGFRAAAERHFGRMRLVGDALMDALELALDLPPRHFAQLMNNSFWCARILGYPPLSPEQALQGEHGVGEHTDYGCWTLLAQDETPDALETRAADGAWIKVPPIKDALVVNLGDMLSVWTGGELAATPHRVRHTVQGRYRTSIAYFHEPNFDAVIQPLKVTGDVRKADRLRLSASTAPLARAAEGGSLLYGEHLFAKVSSNFSFEATDGR